MEISNFEIFKDLLVFKEPGDFYEVLLVKRKKDQVGEDFEKTRSTENIKSYIIESPEDLDKYKDQIIGLCKYFNARAYIDLVKYNHEKVSLQMISSLSERLKQKQYNQHHLFYKSLSKSEGKSLYWMIDLDVKDKGALALVSEILNGLKPTGPKVKLITETVAGYHIITSKFHREEFFKLCKEHDLECGVNSKGTTILYTPQTLKDADKTN